MLTFRALALFNRSEGGLTLKTSALGGHPCKNQTQMKFLWQESKIQIVSIFARKQTLARQERLCIFSSNVFCFVFEKKRTFRFHSLESIDRVKSGRKLNIFARLAIQRYYIKGNLTNLCSFIDSLFSMKCKLCRNWLFRSFWPCEKAMCSLPLQKNVGAENLFFHHVPLFRIPPNYVCKFPKE